MAKSIKKQACGEKMEKAIAALKKDLVFSYGKGNAPLLDKVMVDYYGTLVPVNQMANISAPEPRLLVIQPWDKSALGEIQRAIQKSDLGLNPSNDGSVIRIAIPAMTEERRIELVKLVKRTGEEAKVAIRNNRRDANEELKKKEKSGEMSEDESRRAQEEVQKMTDEYIREVDGIITAKEKEVMEV